MPTNVIYNVIDHLVKLKRPIALPADVKIVLPKDANKYFIFELAVPKEGAVFGDLTLEAHHLTVNEDVFTISGMKSQYHYTATLTDKTNAKFRLHIYYDALDGQISQPFLDKLMVDANYQPVPCEELHRAFSAFANKSIKALVTDLRKNKEAAEREHLLKYMGLEKAAAELSKNLDANKAAYLAKVDELIKALQELACYSTKNSFISGNLSYFKRIRRVLAATTAVAPQPTASDTKQTDPKSKVDAGQPAKKQGVSALSAAAAEVQQPKKKAGLSQAIAKLQKDLAALKTLGGERLADSLVALFTHIIDMEFDIDAELYYATVPDIQSLQLLKKDVEKSGINLLLNMLLAGEYKVAKKLGQFHYALAAPNYLSDLIAKNNPRLIEFLIANKILPVDYNNFVIDNVRYDSLVAYYFKMAAVVPAVASTAGAPAAVSSRASIVDCLDVLIKNGASLMGLDSATGLPFAASLLLDDKHPLRAVLNRNAQFTTNNALFCKQLKHFFLSLIAQPQCPPSVLAKIKPLLVQMEEQIVIAQIVNASPVLVKAQNEMTEYKERLRTNFKEPLIERLEADPEYLSLKAYVERRTAAVFPRLSKRDRMGNKWNDMKKGLEAMLAEKDGLNLSYEKIKAAAIEKFNETLVDIDMTERLLDQQNDFKRVHANRRSANKTNKNLRQIRTELAGRELARGAPARELAEINKKLAAAKNALKFLDAMEGMLGNIVSTLGSLKIEDFAATMPGSDQKHSNAQNGNAFFPAGGSASSAAAGAGTAVDGMDLTSSDTGSQNTLG